MWKKSTLTMCIDSILIGPRRLRQRLFQEYDGLVAVPGGKIWYRHVKGGDDTPLIVIHGGPGFPHDYLETLLPLRKERTIIFYDQLGCGKSDQPTDTSLWTIERSVAELQALIAHLGLRSYILLGHSYGAMVALDFALTSPQGLTALVLASPIINLAHWERDINRYSHELSEHTQNAITTARATKNFDSPAFSRATAEFYHRFVLRLPTWPPLYAASARNANTALYRTMWGPTEFICNGNLVGYDRIDRLHEIHAPVLITCGAWEGACPETMEGYMAQMPRAELAVFHNSAHHPHIEEPTRYIAAVRSFLSNLRTL